MKVKKMIYSLAAVVCLIPALTTNNVSAAEDSGVSPLGLNDNVSTFGAGEWDKIGTWTMSKMIRFQSGGGDLKACVNDSTKKIELTVKRSFFGGKDVVSSGGSPNCATFRDIGGSGYVDFTYTHGPDSINVTIYD